MSAYSYIYIYILIAQLKGGENYNLRIIWKSFSNMYEFDEL